MRVRYLALHADGRTAARRSAYHGLWFHLFRISGNRHIKSYFVDRAHTHKKPSRKSTLSLQTSDRPLSWINLYSQSQCVTITVRNYKYSDSTDSAERQFFSDPDRDPKRIPGSGEWCGSSPKRNNQLVSTLQATPQLSVKFHQNPSVIR